MYDDEKFYFLSMFDGICDQTKKLKTVSGKMDNDETWVISTSGRHIFIDFVVDILHPKPGFSANIHYGTEFKKFYFMMSRNFFGFFTKKLSFYN